MSPGRRGRDTPRCQSRGLGQHGGPESAGKSPGSRILSVPWGMGLSLSPWLPLILTSIVKTAQGQAHSPRDIEPRSTMGCFDGFASCLTLLVSYQEGTALSQAFWRWN